MMHAHGLFLSAGVSAQTNMGPEGDDVTPTIWPPAPNQTDNRLPFEYKSNLALPSMRGGVNWITLILELANSPLFYEVCIPALQQQKGELMC